MLPCESVKVKSSASLQGLSPDAADPAHSMRGASSADVEGSNDRTVARDVEGAVNLLVHTSPRQLRAAMAEFIGSTTTADATYESTT
jgi:hypothetical protein